MRRTLTIELTFREARSIVELMNREMMSINHLVEHMEREEVEGTFSKVLLWRGIIDKFKAATP